MTLLQPHKQPVFINYILGFLIVAVFASALSLVYVYNRFVDTAHSITVLKNDMQKVETESALVRDNIFALTAEHQSESRATAYGLVKEKSPRYLTLDPQWSLASR